MLNGDIRVLGLAVRDFGHTDSEGATALRLTSETAATERSDGLLAGVLRRLGHLGLILPTTGASMVATVSLVETGRVSLPLCAVVWLLVYSSYLIDFIGDINPAAGELACQRTRLLAKRRRFRVLGVASFLAAGALTFAFAGPWLAASLLVFPASVALYGTRLGSRLFPGLGRMKDVPYLKAFYTAFFWALLAPFSASFVSAHHSTCTLFFALLFYTRAFNNICLCDLKDLERDRRAGVRTLALALGQKRLLYVLQVVSFATVPLTAFFVLWGGIPVTVAALCLTLVYFEGMVELVRRQWVDADFLGTVLADAEWIAWPFYLVVAERFLRHLH